MHHGQLRQGHRSVGGQKKRLKDHIRSISRQFNIPFSKLEALASNRATWRSTCVHGISCFGAEYDCAAALRRNRRHQHDAAARPLPYSAPHSPLCGRQSNSDIDLHGHRKTLIQRCRERRCHPQWMDYVNIETVMLCIALFTVLL